MSNSKRTRGRPKRPLTTNLRLMKSTMAYVYAYSRQEKLTLIDAVDRLVTRGFKELSK